MHVHACMHERSLEIYLVQYVVACTGTVPVQYFYASRRSGYSSEYVVV